MAERYTLREPATIGRPRRKILWLALGEGRGHLMRALTMRSLLDPMGVDVEIVTTSDDGGAFLAAFGAPRVVMSQYFGVVYDQCQNVARRRTITRTLRYLLSRRRCLEDVDWLVRRAEGAALVVNDSLHPALLLAALIRPGLARRLVHVHGENMRRAVDEYFGVPSPHSLCVRAAIRRSYAEIEHTLADEPSERAGAFRLPPLVAAPTRSPVEVRRSLGLVPDERLAVVYLNPHFRDPALASALEDALANHAYTMYGVCEGYADRPGWFARDRALADAVAAADLFVSAPGMATLGQVVVYGVPFVALATRQPEQRANLSFVPGVPVVEVDRWMRPNLAAAIDSLAPAPPRVDPTWKVRQVHARWVRTIVGLIEGNQPRSSGCHH